MGSQDLTDEMLELLSEAAVEIANLDDRNNVVYRRLRAMQCRLKILDALAFESKPLETTIGEIAAAVGIAPIDILKAAVVSGVKGYYHDGHFFPDGEKLMAYIRSHNTWDAVPEMMVDLLQGDLLGLLRALELAGHCGPPIEAADKTVPKRKFSASEAELSILSTEQQQRSG